MSKIKILSQQETNEFYSPSTCHNGGGYSQPLYEFKYNGITGTFKEKSCGDFGERFSLDYNGIHIYYDAVEPNYDVTFSASNSPMCADYSSLMQFVYSNTDFCISIFRMFGYDLIKIAYDFNPIGGK